MSGEQFRVGDAERDQVVSALHDNYAQGRLTREELDERMGLTLAAKTVGDLRQVMHDLPLTPETAAIFAGPEQPSPPPPPPQPSPPTQWDQTQWDQGPAPYGHHGPMGPHWGRGGGLRGRRGGRRNPAVLVLVALVVAGAGGWVVLPLIALVALAVGIGGRHSRRSNDDMPPRW